MATAARQDYSMYTLRDFTAAMFRQLHVIGVCWVFLSAAVVAAVLMSPSFYQSEMKVLVTRERADSQVSAAPGAGSTLSQDPSEPELNSEVELLTSHDLLEQVAMDAGLVDKEALAKKDEQERTRELGEAVDRLRGGLGVSPIRRSWMIAITYVAGDPQRARHVLDTLGRLYLAKHLAVRRPAGAYQFFSDQTAASAEQLNQAQAKLQQFADRTHVVSAGVQRDIVIQRLAEFEALQRQTETAAGEASRRIVALQSERASTPERRLGSQRTGDAAGLVQEYQGRLLTLQLKRGELLQKFTPQYRMVVEIDEQIARIRDALDEARRETTKEQTTEENPTIQWLEQEIARIRTERASLETRAALLKGTVQEYRAKAQQLDLDDAEQKALGRDVKSAEEKYLLYQRKQEEARISDALDHTRIANVAIAQRATTPSRAQRTAGLWLIPIGLFASLALGIGAGLVKDKLSSSIRTPDELESAIDLPVLAWVPMIEEARANS
jgi:uncharacterized protein involved in exopolysaccharide biosynthesis